MVIWYSKMKCISFQVYISVTNTLILNLKIEFKDTELHPFVGCAITFVILIFHIKANKMQK